MTFCCSGGHRFRGARELIYLPWHAAVPAGGNSSGVGGAADLLRHAISARRQCAQKAWRRYFDVSAELPPSPPLPLFPSSPAPSAMRFASLLPAASAIKITISPQVSFSFYSSHGPRSLGGRISPALLGHGHAARLTLLLFLSGSAQSARNRDPGDRFTNIQQLKKHSPRSVTLCLLQCYVVAAAQVGSHSAKRASYGHAMCVDPWGRVIAEAGYGFIFACLDLSQ